MLDWHMRYKEPDSVLAPSNRLDNLCCSGIFRGHSWFGQARLRTLAGHRVRISRDYSNTPRVERSRIVTCDRTATNGNVLEIESVLVPRERHSHRRSRWNRPSFWDRNRFTGHFPEP
ncbi:fasciclin-like protein [Elysia marginata]|uniref:Fasciclin-like protein n=1 Tax=Elysia marginata TaxID=1093978 RepID=A0AAV4GMP4_9GAST|nr:fasciclin-like protein [Elysia marginata]